MRNGPGSDLWAVLYGVASKLRPDGHKMYPNAALSAWIIKQLFILGGAGRGPHTAVAGNSPQAADPIVDFKALPQANWWAAVAVVC